MLVSTGRVLRCVLILGSSGSSSRGSCTDNILWLSNISNAIAVQHFNGNQPFCQCSFNINNSACTIHYQNIMALNTCKVIFICFILPKLFQSGSTSKLFSRCLIPDVYNMHDCARDFVKIFSLFLSGVGCYRCSRIYTFFVVENISLFDIMFLCSVFLLCRGTTK